jgi:hypothetical protein
VLQLQVNGKQYSISDPVIQSSSGTVPVKLFEYMDTPESTTKTAIEISHYMKTIKMPNKGQHNSSHTSTYTNGLAVQE